MKAPPSLLYFAYGSNMHPRRMAERVRDAGLVGIGCLPGHVLRFHKRGQDGSGKCNAMYTGNAGDAVHGVVYAVDVAGKRHLDIAEGGYRASEVGIQMRGSRVTCFTYKAEPRSIDESLRPFDWYRRYVLDGALHHGLPAAYVRAVRDEMAVSDSDEVRRFRQMLRLGSADPAAAASPFPAAHQRGQTDG